MQDRPRIVVLMDWYLPGTKAGGPVRSVYSLLKVLNEFFDFYLITKNTDLGSDVPYKSITPNTLFKQDNVFYYYFDNQSLNASNLEKVIHGINPHLVYCNSFWSYYFSILPVRLASKNKIAAPVLLAPRGMLGKGALGLKSAKKQMYLLVAGLMGWYGKIIFHATQNQELTDIRTYFKNQKILVAPNINSSGVVTNSADKTSGHLRLFYLSRVARVKNLHFALECLKRVNNTFKVEYDIYGNLEDQEYWQECESLIRTLPQHIIVNYRRELSFHEVQQVISGYHGLFLPTLNENFGHSIVESLLCGCPVIISDQTPWSDAESQDAGFAIPLEDMNKFVEAIETMATLDQEQFLLKSKHAIGYVRSRIDLTTIIDQYKKLFNDCIKN